MATIALTVPVAHELFQRDGIGIGCGQGDILIVGTYTGAPTAIEASWNGGAYTTVVSSPSGGTFTTKLGRQSVGNGTLTVRFTNDTTVNVSVSNVKVGDFYVILGQSQASGRGTNNQPYTGTANWASMLVVAGNHWVALSDPTALAESGNGSAWPSMCSDIVNNYGVPVAIMNLALGGTSITDWQSGHTAYANIAAYMTYAPHIKRPMAFLFWQGETDALNGMSQATYFADLTTFVASLMTDWKVATMQCKNEEQPAVSDGNEAVIRAGIGQGWQQLVNIRQGPDLGDISADVGDGLHITTDAKLLLCGQRWAAALGSINYPALKGAALSRLFTGM